MNEVNERFTNNSVLNLVESVSSKKTLDATRNSIKILRDFCVCRGLSEDVESYCDIELDNLLADFYVNVRTKQEQLYTKSSLISFRHGINRFLGRTILTGNEFRKSSESFRAVLKHLRQEGKRSVEHKTPISPLDMQKLYQHPIVFNPDIPQGLLNKVWFEIVFYFCRRGQENQRELTPGHFEICHDDSGRKFVRSKSEKDKNHSGEFHFFEGKGAYMYATGTKMCPVASFEKYLSKRNKDEPALFQRALFTFDNEQDKWYYRSSLGKDTLAGMMKQITQRANLSAVYKPQLSQYCFKMGLSREKLHPFRVTKNPVSIQSYCTDSSAMEKREMADALTKYTWQGCATQVPNRQSLTTQNYSKSSESSRSARHDSYMNTSDDELLFSFSQQIESRFMGNREGQHRPIFNFSGCVFNFNGKQ